MERTILGYRWNHFAFTVVFCLMVLMFIPSESATEQNPVNWKNDGQNPDDLRVLSLLPSGNAATEVDDGDGHTWTKTFLVPVTANASITVVATPDRAIQEADLPDEWTLTGGNGNGRLARNIDRTRTGKYTITCSCGMSRKVTTVIVVNVDLDVDSNNDGTINDCDDLLEVNAPGKLVYLNHDDDNMNDKEDLTENNAVVTNENDLQTMNLSFAPSTLSVGKIILSATDGDSCIQVWKNPAKGGASNKVTLPKTWILGTDTVPSTLYVEGINTGAVTLKLAYEVNTMEVCSDEVKMGVVKIDFKERNDTNYGYDDGTIDDNPVPTSQGTSSQKYDWVSIDKNSKTTDVDVEITPSNFAQYVHFVASDTEKATCMPSQVSSSPLKLTLTGKGVGKSHIQTRLGTTDGAAGVQLNVACYQLAVLRADFYKVQATGLIPDTTTSADLESGANEFMKRGVSKLVLTNRGTLTIEYDDNNNSMLDIDTTVANGGSEWNKIVTNPNVSSTEINILHVKAICLITDSMWSFPAGMRYGNWIIVTDASSSKKRTVAHEMLHKLDIRDVGPNSKNTANIMYYMSNTTKYFVGYFKVEWVQTGSGTSYTPKKFQSQWDAIYRTTD